MLLASAFFLPGGATTMFAVRVRASLKHLFHGRHSSSFSLNCEIASNSKRILHYRFNDGKRILNSLRLSGNGIGIRLFYRSFHTSPQCYNSESDLGVKNYAPASFSYLEDDPFIELGSVEKDGNPNVVLKLLTEKPELSRDNKSKKKKKKKIQASRSISKPKLLTEKPEVSWKTNDKRKTEANASSSAKSVADFNVSFAEPSTLSSPIRDHKSKTQNIISPGSEAKNKTSSKSSSTCNSPSDHSSSVVVIRIGNLNSKTADSVIHSMCLSICSLEGLVRVKEDTVDVFFQVNHLNEADCILEELKDATVDNSQWTAEIVPEAEERSKHQMGVKITSCYDELDKQLVMRRILGKDLEVLLHSLMHLENHPMTRERD